MDDSAIVHLWAGKLSTIHATFRLWVANMPSNFYNHLLKMLEVIHDLDCVTYSVGRRLSSLKHLGLALRPMTKTGNFSPKDIKFIAFIYLPYYPPKAQ